jgi:hypothetical protein
MAAYRIAVMSEYFEKFGAVLIIRLQFALQNETSNNLHAFLVCYLPVNFNLFAI